MRARVKDAAFVWQAGARIAGTPVWCDGGPKRALAFASHAGMKHVLKPGAHARVLASGETVALAKKRRVKVTQDLLPALLGRPIALGRMRLELLPSGFMPGAAQLLVETPERKVLWSAALGPGAQVRACDAVAIDLAASSVTPEELAAHARATGARDVFLLSDPPAALVEGLSGLRLHALGPPSQMRLFR